MPQDKKRDGSSEGTVPTKASNKAASRSDTNPAGGIIGSSPAPDAVVKKWSFKGDSEKQAPLSIARNKHWRYISSYHGPWLQMPIATLETIAHVNYRCAPPRPIDAAMLYDVLKIRRLVDEATNLAVRATSDAASTTLTNVNGGYPGFQALSLESAGALHGAKLSKERKFRMREQASQKLARAYRLDEIIASVAIMQGPSILQDIGKLVLLRNSQDLDAKYVQFFHEKVPSRKVAEVTDIGILDDIISNRHGEAEALRTRAHIRLIQKDFHPAIQDLSSALTIHRYHHAPAQIHPSRTCSSVTDVKKHALRGSSDTYLAEHEQPSSFESQALFHRASLHLTAAWELVADGLAQHPRDVLYVPGHMTERKIQGSTQRKPHPMANVRFLILDQEVRKHVKVLARRAIKDFMAFFALLDYAPRLPCCNLDDFNERTSAAYGHRRMPRPGQFHTEPPGSYTVYTVADLFAPIPPSDLPAFSAENQKDKHDEHNPPEECQWVTYNPLLGDALHQFLLAHGLAQTSTKEVQRHAYMAARLTGLLDGYPCFLVCRSAARSDWADILHQAPEWLELSAPWDTLCAQNTVFRTPCCGSDCAVKNHAAHAAAAQLCSKENPSLLDVPGKEPPPFKPKLIDPMAAVKAEQASYFGSYPTAENVSIEQDWKLQAAKSALRQEKAGLVEDGSLLDTRAYMVWRWIVEIPTVTGTARRKKKPKKSVSGAPPPEEGGVEDEMEKLKVNDDNA